MSLIHDISAAFGSMGRTGVGPAAAPGADEQSAELRRKLAPAFRTSFDAGIERVLDGATSGEFEDPQIAARIKALEQRLRQRSMAQLSPTPPLPRAGGANGGVAGGTGGQRPGGLPDVVSASPVEARELLELQSQQAAARLSKVSASVRSRFHDWNADPHVARADLRTFTPRTREQAEAFAQRLVVELTEGAAKLEVAATQLELARFEAQRAPNAEATREVAQLEAQHAALERYVIEVAEVVDRQSDDAVSRTAPAADAQLGSVVGEAVRNGISGEDLEKLRKAVTIAGEEAATGNSQVVNDIQHQLSDTMFSIMRSKWRRDEERAEQDQRRYEHMRLEQRASERTQRQRASDERASQLAAQRSAEVAALYRQGAAERES